MVDARLVDYIKGELLADYKLSTIRTALVQAGHTEQEVEGAIGVAIGIGIPVPAEFREKKEEKIDVPIYWWVLPFFGVPGGAIAYYFLKDKDKGLAKKLFAMSCIIMAIEIILYILVTWMLGYLESVAGMLDVSAMQDMSGW